MPGSSNKVYPFNNDYTFNFRSILGVTVGIFLFLIFFLPLNPLTEEFNKKTLILAGFGGIIFIFLMLLRIVIPSLFPKLFRPEKWSLMKEIVLHFLFLVLNSVAFSFYARYVGKIEVTFHLVVNIVLISLAPVIILIIIYEYNFLKKRLQELLNQNDLPEILENTDGIEFESENQSEHLFLFPEQIILIKSANNYIEIIYKQNKKVSRRLIRNSLKNTEKLLSKYPSLIRCHRSYIINKNCIQNIQKGAEGLKLSLFDYSFEINVSRQYVLKVKEALKQSD